MMRAGLLVLLLVFIAIGCAPARPKLETYHRLDNPADINGGDASSLNDGIYTGLLADLRSGDMVLAVREDPITPAVRLATTEPSYFTHSAILEVTNETHRGEVRRDVKAWHAIGDFNILHFSPHVLGKVRGGVRSIKLNELIRMYDALVVVRLPDESKNATMVEVCRRLHDEGVEFDSFMNCADDSEVCCTELNVIAMREAGYAFAPEPLPRTKVPELDALMTELNITTPAIYMAGQFEGLPGAEVVTVISRYSRMETYLAMHDAAELIHERVNNGTIILSDLCGFDRHRMVHYTDRMELYLRGVEGLAKASPTGDQAEIRQRNEVVFGAVFGTRAR